MALPSKMNVMVVYNRDHHTAGIEFTMEHMLERWYNDKLFNIKPDKAQTLLIEILEGSKVPPNYVSQVKKAFPKAK